MREKIKIGQRVLVDHYENQAPLKGVVSEINKKGLIIVSLDIGGMKETFPPFVRLDPEVCTLTDNELVEACHKSISR